MIENRPIATTPGKISRSPVKFNLRNSHLIRHSSTYLEDKPKSATTEHLAALDVVALDEMPRPQVHEDDVRGDERQGDVRVPRAADGLVAVGREYALLDHPGVDDVVLGRVEVVLGYVGVALERGHAARGRAVVADAAVAVGLVAVLALALLVHVVPGCCGGKSDVERVGWGFRGIESTLGRSNV